MADLLWYLCTTGLIFLLLFSLYCNIRIIRTTRDYIFSTVDELPYRKVGLLLGTSKYLRGGMDNPYFTYRMRAAAELYREGKIAFIIASGDNSKSWYNEPVQMRDDLVGHGIPPERVFLDYAGFRTLDSVIRAEKIFGQREFTVISQGFHNRRAVYIARVYGLGVIGYNSRDVRGKYGTKTRIREYFARVKAFMDVHILHTRPRFLGEKIDIE